MIKHILVGLLIFGMLVNKPVLGADLANYRWKNRLLLIFSPTEINEAYKAFEAKLKGAASEVEDRDLILFRIFENGLSFIGSQSMSAQDAEALRRRFPSATGQFSVVLIGKDGGIKLEQKDQADINKIFDRIDSMPMRQQEIKERQ